MSEPVDQPAVDERLRLVYTEALRGVTQQQAVLENLRGRSALLLSAGAVATSFLAGYALPRRSGVAVVAAVVVAALFVGVVVLTLLTLIPQTWTFRNDPQVLLADWVDSKNYSLDKMHRELADWLGKHYDENEDTLTYLQRLYLCASGCLGVEIVVLLALALTKGNAS